MMKYSKITIPSMALAILILSSYAIVPKAFAHQRQLYMIGDKDYLMVIGSLNEPVYVDDQSGVDFRVMTPDPNDPMNSGAAGAKPVEGLEKTLKVEIAAGDKKMTLPLEPAFGNPGHYEATFYPTVATTFSYRVFGTINDTPVDLTFTCTPTGEAGSTANNTAVQVSDGVLRKDVEGGYGCPSPRTDAGFPEPYTSNHDLAASLKQIQSDVSSIKSSVSSTAPTASGDGSETMSWAGIGTGIAGIAIAVGAIVIASRKKAGGR